MFVLLSDLINLVRLPFNVVLLTLIEVQSFNSFSFIKKMSIIVAVWSLCMDAITVLFFCLSQLIDSESEKAKLLRNFKIAVKLMELCLVLILLNAFEVYVMFIELGAELHKTYVAYWIDAGDSTVVCMALLNAVATLCVSSTVLYFVDDFKKLKESIDSNTFEPHWFIKLIPLCVVKKIANAGCKSEISERMTYYALLIVFGECFVFLCLVPFVLTIFTEVFFLFIGLVAVLFLVGVCLCLSLGTTGVLALIRSGCGICCDKRMEDTTVQTIVDHPDNF